jgi:hypothetical protein
MKSRHKIEIFHLSVLSDISRNKIGDLMIKPCNISMNE